MSDELTALLAEIDRLKQKLDAARPLVNDSILNTIDIEYTYNSNSIEGNTLTLRETDIIINKGLTIAGKSMREHLEASNHYEAILYVRELIVGKQQISETIIKNVHAIILRGIDRENAGRYRSVPVAISGNRHIPPQPWLIPKMMEDLGYWIVEAETRLHPVIYAAEIHERIATIHPFIDGNGRTARLIMNLVLLGHGYAIANISGEIQSRLAYYNTLEKCNLYNDKLDFFLLIAGYVHVGLKKLASLIGT